MTYRGVITIDYTKSKPNEYNRLLNAICQCGWKYAETSALSVDCEDLTPIMKALEVLARAVDTGGTLSALNLHVQLVGEVRDPPGAQNNKNALANLLKIQLPSEEQQN
jgi:hypothetical protein